MTATPVQTNVARQFLTAPAGEAWDPDQRTYVYEEASRPRAQSSVPGRVQVVLDDAYTFDSRGVFAGMLPGDESTLQFRMDFEDGEWRIDTVPNALIVPRTWTDDHFEQVNVYYLDPTGEHPGARAGARCRAASSSRPPSPRACSPVPDRTCDQVSRNFFPSRLTLVLSVPVDDQGLADVALQGDASGMSPQESELAAVQLAWTLRQDPSIRAIRLTADGESLPGLSREIRVDKGAEYDPADFSSSTVDVRAPRGPPGRRRPRTPSPRSTGWSVSATTA